MKSADIVVSILVVCLTLSSSTCSLFDEELSSTDSDGALIDSKPLWIQPTTGSSNELNFAALHFSTVYNGSVIVPKYANGESSLLLVDGATGAVQWEWKDAFEVDSDRLIVDYSYIYKNTFTFPRRGRIYQIDLNSGNTIFKMDTGDWIRRITGLGPTYYLSSLINISEDTIINQGSAYYGIIGGMPRYEHLFTPPYQNTDSSGQFGLGATSIIVPFVEDGRELTAFCYTDIHPNFNSIKHGLFDIAADTFVYADKTTVAETDVSANGRLMLHDGYAYASYAKQIICYDVMTGEIQWRKQFSESFTFSGYIIVDGMLLANNEDRHLYALDPLTGREIYRTRTSGTSSELVALNGVLYFVGGGDGLLHAVDIASGRHLWKMRSPDMEANGGAFFMPHVNIVPSENPDEKGYIVVSSYLSAMAYEAIR